MKSHTGIYCDEYNHRKGHFCSNIAKVRVTFDRNRSTRNGRMTNTFDVCQGHAVAIVRWCLPHNNPNLWVTALKFDRI